MPWVTSCQVRTPTFLRNGYYLSAKLNLEPGQVRVSQISLGAGASFVIILSARLDSRIDRKGQCIIVEQKKSWTARKDVFTAGADHVRESSARLEVNADRECT